MYHSACLKVNIKDIDVKKWKCKNCSINCGLEDRLKNFISQMFKDMNTKMAELQKSQEYISEQHDEILKHLSDLALVKKEVVELKEKFNKSEAEKVQLQARLNHLEQYGRNRNLEINELACQQGEDTEALVLKVANRLQVQLGKEDIEACHRIPSKIKDKIPTIIVQFQSRKKRDEILEKKRQVVTNSDILGRGTGRIYLAENLSPYYRDLLWKAKLKAKAAGYKFVWWKKDKIFARKVENSPVVSIISEKDIEKISAS